LHTIDTDNNYVYRSRLVDLGLLPSSHNVTTFQYFLGVGLLAATVFCYLILFSFCVYVMVKGIRSLLNIRTKNFVENKIRGGSRLLLTNRKCSHPLSAIVIPAEFSLEETKDQSTKFLVLPSTSEANIYCSNDGRPISPSFAIIMASSTDEKCIS